MPNPPREVTCSRTARIRYPCLRRAATDRPTLQPGVTFDTAINTVPTVVTWALALAFVVGMVVSVLVVRTQTTKHREERLRLQAEAEGARTRAEAAALERAQLDAQLRATREAADAQREAVQHLSAELGERLLQQQASAFEATTAALERRASSESEAIRAAYEAATAERNERLRVELQPVHETLQRLTETTVATDTRSAMEFSRLVTLLQGLTDEERAHREDTRKIGSALRVTQVRGRFGEWTLQRTLEAAGLQEHQHYLVQPNGRDEQGAFRPDVVVLLPQDRCVIVDSKMPLQHLLDAQHAAEQDERNRLLDRHAKALRVHIDQLSGKHYPARLAAGMPGRSVLDAALLFLPTDGVLEAALRRDPHLLQHAASRRVHLVTPTSLPLMLSAVEQLWRQDGRDRRADEVEQLGVDVIERIAVVLGHVARLQRQVGEMVGTYNALTASLESRLLPVARRLETLGVRAREALPTVSEIDTLPRELGPRLTAVLHPVSATSDDGALTDVHRAA
jgi:DNA recombination protein RmuC